MNPSGGNNPVIADKSLYSEEFDLNTMCPVSDAVYRDMYLVVMNEQDALMAYVDRVVAGEFEDVNEALAITGTEV